MVHRNDIRTSCIVCLHHNLIALPIFYLLTNLTDKSGISSLVCTHQITVDIHFRTSPHTFKAQEQTFPLHGLGNHISLTIISRPLIKRVCLYLHILRIPGMRDGHLCPFTLPLGSCLHHVCCKRPFFKQPAIIKTDYLS